MNDMNLKESITHLCQDLNFSGVIKLANNNMEDVNLSLGYSNRSEKSFNNLDTRFGIASGCKLFTAIAICQLVEAGKLSFQTKLRDCLDVDFQSFSQGITVHHLLTHSSGVPDYFDEEVMEDFEELWKEVPMYHIRKLKDFLPLFQNKEAMVEPGGKFHYNNAGYILLGLIIEEVSGMEFADYVEKNVFEAAGMSRSGYFSMDRLPENTTFGYIDDEEDGSWRTNIYSLPVKGGADGGAFTTAADMITCWQALFDNKLLSQPYTDHLLTPHICEDGDEYYGYGLWISKKQGEIYKYHIMGYDPGVSFHSAVYPREGKSLVIISNKEAGPYGVMKLVEEKWLK